MDRNAPSVYVRHQQRSLGCSMRSYAPFTQNTLACFRHYMDDCIIMTEPGQRELHEEICHMFLRSFGTASTLPQNRLNANSSKQRWIISESALKVRRN